MNETVYQAFREWLAFSFCLCAYVFIVDFRFYEEKKAGMQCYQISITGKNNSSKHSNKKGQNEQQLGILPVHLNLSRKGTGRGKEETELSIKKTCNS
jgi:hypothetical protein